MTAAVHTQFGLLAVSQVPELQCESIVHSVPNPPVYAIPGLHAVRRPVALALADTVAAADTLAAADPLAAAALGSSALNESSTRPC